MASAIARFTTEVVFPTPPFWFATATMWFSRKEGSCVSSKRRLASMVFWISTAIGVSACEVGS